MALPNLVLLDPEVPQGPKVLKAVVVILVNLDQIVKVQSEVLKGILVLLDPMESQDVLVRLGKQVKTFLSLETMGTMGSWDVLEARAKLVFLGPVDCQVSLEILE